MWPFGKIEHRESATDAVVSALLSQAAGSSVPPSVEALGAVEAAAGLWSRAFCIGNRRALDHGNVGAHTVRAGRHRAWSGRSR